MVKDMFTWHWYCSEPHFVVINYIIADVRADGSVTIAIPAEVIGNITGSTGSATAVAIPVSSTSSSTVNARVNILVCAG